MCIVAAKNVENTDVEYRMLSQFTVLCVEHI